MEGVSSARRQPPEPDISGLIRESLTQRLRDAESFAEWLRIVQSVAERLRITQSVPQRLRLSEPVTELFDRHPESLSIGSVPVPA
ncbi:hypothetical protein GCM10010404_27270 [Nonomuraea africana]|uniref:Uncharacterized protein n=1 Tax=Nonomuraea africana TaxID=46171 RepID=A0ABR9KPL1_9ACTN|nr:hypothetical protein [Nonomuraea africana]MBE1563548.1 hypothetical protein [Nonomuraea africana]